MKTMRELTEGKPSNAIFGMIEGLKEQSLRDDFVIDMTTFGSISFFEKSICVGCAATCAIQKISKIKLNISNITERAEAIKVNSSDLTRFEGVIDTLRSGLIYGLEGYYDKELPEVDLPYLGTTNWQKNLQPYEEYANKLKQLGL